MEPANYDITIHPGATFELDLQYKDEANVPIDMTGYTVAGQVWDRIGTSKLADFTPVWVNQASGQFKLRMAPAVTKALTTQAQYDVLVTEPGGDRFYILQGVAKIDPGLTGRDL